MESKDWAQCYTEDTTGLSKPWLLIQWRLKLLQDQRATLCPKTYLAERAEPHQASMNIGEWWQGQEAGVFSTENLPGERI